MRKYFKYIFIFFICFMFVDGVYAERTLVCKYKGNNNDPYIGAQEYIYEIKLVIDGENVQVSELRGTKEVLDIEFCKGNSIYFADFGDAEEIVKKTCVSGKRNIKFEKNKKINFKITESDDCPPSIVVFNDEGTTNIYTGDQKSGYESYALKSSKYVDKYSCGNITGIPKKIPELTSFAVTLIQIAIPIVLILLGSIDLFKGITANKDD